MGQTICWSITLVSGDQFICLSGILLGFDKAPLNDSYNCEIDGAMRHYSFCTVNLFTLLDVKVSDII